MFISQSKLTWDIGFSFNSLSLVVYHACKLLLIYHYNVNSCFKCDKEN